MLRNGQLVRHFGLAQVTAYGLPNGPRDLTPDGALSGEDHRPPRLLPLHA
jgi:hypothetical protein